MKVTIRDGKVFLLGMIFAFSLAIAVISSSLSQQQFIAGAIPVAVLSMVTILIGSVLFTVTMSFVKRAKKEVTQ